MRPAARPAAVAALLLLSACARHHGLAAASDHAAPPPPRPVLEPRYASVTPPPRDDQGEFRTINSGLDAEQTIWHVRAALNVAAIGCRGAADTDTVRAYNAMLSTKKKLLADANKAFLASFRTAGDPGASDSYMTRLYNYFALPAAKPGFCAAAAKIAPEAAAAAPAEFPAFAATTLPTLEAPFLAVYRAIDEYRTASAAWDARYGPGATQRVEVAETKRGTRGPRLAYADLGPVIAWQPATRERLASR